MKRKCVTLLFIIFVSSVFAQNMNDYQTVDSANALWSESTAWQRWNGFQWVQAVASPTAASAEQVVIRNGAVINIAADLSADQLIIEPLAQLHITAGAFTIANGAGTDLLVNGYLRLRNNTMSLSSGAVAVFASGSTYEHDRSLNAPIISATWEDGSTCLLTGVYTVAELTNLSYACMKQDFYNLTLDYGSFVSDYRAFAANDPIDVRGTLSLLSGNLYVGTGISASNLNVNNLTINGGKFVVSRGYAIPSVTIRNNLTLESGTVVVSELGDAVQRDYTVQAKNVTIESGVFELNAGSSASKSTGQVYISGSLVMNGGTLKNNPGLSTTKAGIFFNGSGDQNVILTGGSLSADPGGVGRLFFYRTSSVTSLSETYGAETEQYTINGLGGASLPSGYSAWPVSGNLIKILNVSNPAGVKLSTAKTIIDNLSLSAGTLGLNGKALNLANEILLSRKGGNLSSSPSFGSSIYLSYLQNPDIIVMGNEVPDTDIVQNLVINTLNGVQMNKDIVVNGSLTFHNGFLDLSGYELSISMLDLSFSGDTSLSNMNLSLSNEAATQGDGLESIERKWLIQGSSSSEVLCSFFWPVELDNGGDFSSGATLWRYNGHAWEVVEEALTVSNNGEIHEISCYLNLGGKADAADEYTITGEGQTLPVVLSAFFAVPTQNAYPLLKWMTQSETGLMGYYVYRSSNSNVTEAKPISSLIDAVNMSHGYTYSYIDKGLEDVGEYYYWLQIVDFSGEDQFFGPAQYSYNPQEPGNPEVPLFNGIDKLYPNPFNPSLNICFCLKNAAPVRMKIYNIKGQLAHEALLGMQQSGNHKYVWDAGAISDTSGIYTIRLEIGSEVYTQKVTMLK
ncbi:MAG: hypothetical protein CVU50_06200 [Candidatus Cloacimonetes bacterium HGW-Cloacimonetes-3]|jgi:hypothetical protein|nr:MAG: hypothetical protein CVU50_06200 [Candidatus Cloacimonetes bacterium HGW-Cloacimonetes-3]